MKFKLEFTFDISDSSLLIDANDGRSEEYTSLEDVPEDMWQAMKAYDYLDKMPVVSEERIREELTKCFKCNSSLTLGWLSELTDLRDYIFKNTNLWLKPTSEK